MGHWQWPMTHVQGRIQKIVLGGARWTWVAEAVEGGRSGEGVNQGVYPFPSQLGGLGSRERRSGAVKIWPAWILVGSCSDLPDHFRWPWVWRGHVPLVPPIWIRPCSCVPSKNGDPWPTDPFLSLTVLLHMMLTVSHVIIPIPCSRWNQFEAICEHGDYVWSVGLHLLGGGSLYCIGDWQEGTWGLPCLHFS